MINRRQFLKAAGLTSLGLLTACNQSQWMLGQAGLPAPILSSLQNSNEEKLASHVVKRLTYGATPGQIQQVASQGIRNFIDEQLNPEQLDDSRAYWLVRRIDTINFKTPDIFELTAKQAIKDLRQATILRATYSNRQLQEMMVEFWSDHFNIYSEKSNCAWLKVIDDREVIRKHALGNFRDLLHASALSPAMLCYLDGSSNIVGNPNENYARELLELHTLGVNGGYKQTDVMQAAKALTGWQIKEHFWRGKVQFDNKLHDSGEKQILEKTFAANSNTDLEDLIYLVSKHPSTANFISNKLCRRFVSETPSKELIAQVAKNFQETNGNIRETLRTLFFSEEFLNAPPKFKRPYTYAISALRALSANSNGDLALQNHLESMGQLPFNWPTPDGFPEEQEHWQNQLVARWNFAISLAHNQIKGTSAKLDSILENPIAYVPNFIQRPLQENELAAIQQAETPNDKVALLLCLPDFQYQ
jgi:uncharacterized protein (DUF1800 family)